MHTPNDYLVTRKNTKNQLRTDIKKNEQVLTNPSPL